VCSSDLPVFVGGLPRTPSQPGYISRPGGEYAD